MTLPADTYLYEFLYRGQPAGAAQPPAWHVILARPGQDGFGASLLTLSPAMTPDQAAALGVDLPAVLAAINAAALQRIAKLEAEVARLQPAGPNPAPANPSAPGT